jgi:hypothetical protein
MSEPLTIRVAHKPTRCASGLHGSGDSKPFTCLVRLRWSGPSGFVANLPPCYREKVSHAAMFPD